MDQSGHPLANRLSLDVRIHRRRMPKVRMIEVQKDPNRPIYILLLFAAVAGVLAALLFVPAWRQTPKGVSPTVRVRGIDLLQAWSLARSARKSAAEGKNNLALHAWRSAIANRPGAPHLLREALDFVSKLPDPDPQALSFGLACSQWLLRNSPDNPTDLGRILQFLHGRGMYEEAVLFGTPSEAKLGPTEARPLLFAHMHLLRHEDFNRIWTRFADNYNKDDLAQLYRSAALAMTGPPEQQEPARARVEAAAAASGPLSVPALRLSLLIAFHHAELEPYERSLERLTREHLQTLQDQVRHWRLLHHNGRRQQAREAAEAFNAPLASPTEVLLLTGALLELRLTDSALRLFRTAAPRFPGNPSLWGLYAQTLLQAQKTDDAAFVAAGIRASPDLAKPLQAEAIVLDLLARDEAGNPDAVRDLADRLVAIEKLSPRIVRPATSLLRRCGLHRHAGVILARSEKDFAQDRSYWLERTDAAVKDRDPDALLAAAQGAHRKYPRDPVFMHNHATALLFARSRPEEAIALTWEIFNQRPNFPYAAVNHVSALFQLGRTEEAHALLRKINTPRTSPTEEAVYQLAWLEHHIAANDPDGIRNTARLIPREELFPAQKERLEFALRRAAELASRPASQTPR